MRADLSSPSTVIHYQLPLRSVISCLQGINECNNTTIVVWLYIYHTEDIEYISIKLKILEQLNFTGYIDTIQIVFEVFRESKSFLSRNTLRFLLVRFSCQTCVFTWFIFITHRAFIIPNSLPWNIERECVTENCTAIRIIKVKHIDYI